MLEKIGLPAKPSMRGGSWVVDASHCQGCSSQFTFVNRKHHCRRCGGLFCNNCTQQRMMLRGQGDSPVRICDPCKKLEEAARFELRYGHKSRVAKGSSKLAPKNEDEFLHQILGPDVKQEYLLRDPQLDVVSDSQNDGSSASCSNSQEEFVTPNKTEDILRSISVDLHHSTPKESGSVSPEELRQRAVEEKKKYRVLKGEGKSEAALQAFKRGKELERQAEALDLAIRKNRRKASILSSFTGPQKTNDDHEASVGKRKLPSQLGKEEKDELASELRELGWSDADLQDERKLEKPTLESELSNLLGDVPKKSRLGQGTSCIDKSQVLAHKKKALTLKREGKLQEAKEELKKAKILEKELEEQELLVEADDSDDELSALIRSMDDVKQDDISLDYAHDPNIDFNYLLGVADDHAFDGTFDVTDDDMNDPDIAAALQSFGWSKEDNHLEKDGVRSPLNHDILQGEVLFLKKEALNQKRAGNAKEAMELLRKAKLLERDNNIQSSVQTFEPSILQKQSTPQISGDLSLPRMVDDRNAAKMDHNLTSLPKSRLAIQRELLGLKKKALALRREGRIDEAEEELKKGKVLESQLEEMDKAPKSVATEVVAGKKRLPPSHGHEDVSVTMGPVEDGEEAEVTEQDMHDPSLLSVLQNLGWKDEDSEAVGITGKPSKQITDQTMHENGRSTKPVRNKAEIKRELLGLKREAFSLRRQGKIEEAEEVLKKAKVLENQIADLEVPPTEIRLDSFQSVVSEEKTEVLKTPTSSTSFPETVTFKSQFTTKVDASDKQEASEQVNIRRHSGQSVDLVDLLSGNYEKNPQNSIPQLAPELNPVTKTRSLDVATVSSGVPLKDKDTTANGKEISGSNRVLDQHIIENKETAIPATNELSAHEANLIHGVNHGKDQILACKRRAVALKREGKLAEAREELRQAKLLEKSLEEDGDQGNMVGKIASSSASADTHVMQESKPAEMQKPKSGRDRFKLQQESLAHKRQALKLRREGRMEESEAEFELAKQLEAQLEDADNHINKVESVGDAVVEDLLDPQLRSALKAIGWEEADISTNNPLPQKSKTKMNVGKSSNANSEKAHLEEQIKAEKLRALDLKRAGQQAEALEALRAAKRLEKKLVSSIP